jgi:apolipoprotein N-acyltransferase
MWKIIKNIFLRFIAPVFLSAVLLRLSFTRSVPGTLVFFSLIPVCAAAKNWSRAVSALGFFLTGSVFYSLLLFWMREQSLAGMLTVAAYCAAYYAPIGFLLGNRAENLISLRSKVIIALLWVILEYLRSEIYIGFPWGLLGCALHKETVLIQLADITGVYGITFFIVFINLLLASLFVYLSRKDTARLHKLRFMYIHLSIVLFLFSFLIISGELKLSRPRAKGDVVLSIGLIQPNVESAVKWDYRERKNLLALYKQMSLRVKNVDLLIWPESVLPGELFYDSQLLTTIEEIMADNPVNLLLGSGNLSFERKKDAWGEAYRKIYYNSVYLMDSRSAIKEIYNKIKLVPFGEFIPFEKYFPRLRLLTPVEESYHPGKHYTLFHIYKGRQAIPFASVICIEDIYPRLVRKFVGNGARFVVNVTNDGWFSGTPCAYQHFAHSILRAVENRVPLIRCTNTGVSAVISPDGSIEKIISSGYRLSDIRGMLTGNISIPLNGKPTFYTKHGDLFTGIAALFVFLYFLKDLLPLLPFRRKK